MNRDDIAAGLDKAETRATKPGRPMFPVTWPGGLGHSANPQRPPGEQWKDDPYEYRAKQLWEARHGTGANRTPLERGLERTHEAEAAYVQELQDILDRTPQERAAKVHKAEEEQPRHWHQAIWNAIGKLGATLVEHRAGLDARADMITELREWVQELEDGNRNLGRRVAQLEDWKGRAIDADPRLGAKEGGNGG